MSEPIAESPIAGAQTEESAAEVLEAVASSAAGTQAVAEPEVLESAEENSEALPESFSHASMQDYEAAQKQPQGTTAKPAVEPMSGIVLMAAALSVFDTVLAIGLLSFWMMDPNEMLEIFRSLAGVSLIMGIWPIIVGGLILQKNRNLGQELPGSIWGKVGILAGLFLSFVTLIIPAASAMISLLSLSTS